MPGRQGKQRIKKKKSKRLPVTEMEKTLKDSIHGRKRNEKAILKNLIPPKLVPKANKVAVTSSLPMFQACDVAPRPAAASVSTSEAASPASPRTAVAHADAKKKGRGKK